MPVVTIYRPKFEWQKAEISNPAAHRGVGIQVETATLQKGHNMFCYVPKRLHHIGQNGTEGRSLPKRSDLSWSKRPLRKTTKTVTQYLVNMGNWGDHNQNDHKAKTATEGESLPH